MCEHERRNRTLGILLDYRAEVASWHAMTLSGDLSWTSRYEEIIEADDAGPDEARQHLTGAELARILREDWSDPA